MPLLAASTPFARYLVQTSDITDNLRDKVFKGLTDNAMPVMESELDEIVAGWTPFESPYNADFNAHSITYGTDMVFSLRVDKKKVPAALIKKELAIAIEKKKSEQHREFLSRNEKNELKEMVIDTLFRKTPFTTEIHHVSWNSNTNELYFFAAAKAAKELFETLFFKSFDMKLVPLFPFSIANFKMGSLSAQDKEKLATLTPTGGF